jgi:hypothetical protein
METTTKDELEQERDPAQQAGRTNVERMPERKKAARDDFSGEGFDVRDEAFEGATTVIEWRPANLPKGKDGLKAEIRLNVLSSQDLEDYERALEDARFRSNRITFLSEKLARVDDIGDLDDLENDPGSDEAQQLRESIEAYRSRPDSMAVNTNSILLPTVVRWNMKAAGVPVPLVQTDIRTQVPLTAVTGLASLIVSTIQDQQKHKGRGSKSHRRY